MITSDSDLVQGVVQRLRARAKVLRRAATGTLILIIGVLAAGLSIFLLAGELANREARKALVKAKTDVVEFLNAEVSDTEQRLNAAEDEISYYRDELRQEVQRSDRPGQGPIALQIREQLERAQVRRGQLQENLRDLEARRELARADLERAGESGLYGSFESETSTLVSVIVTRVSSIILLLFLVQILVPLYRYNTRLAAYYEARGDALEILDFNDPGCIEGLERLVSALSPDSVTFEKHPATPLNQSLSMVRSTLAKRARQ